MCCALQCREWNTNTRNAHMAQVLLRAILSKHTPQQILAVPGELICSDPSSLCQQTDTPYQHSTSSCVHAVLCGAAESRACLMCLPACCQLQRAHCGLVDVQHMSTSDNARAPGITSHM